MASLTLAIRGLCAVTFRGGNPPKYEVLLNSSHGHTATLMALTEFLDPEELDNPWQPDALAFVPVFSNGNVDFKQAALWFLKGKRVTFSGGAGSLQKWDNRDDAIDFHTLNGGSKVGNVGSAFGVVEIAQGKPSSERLRQFTLDGPKEIKKKFATEVQWSDLPVVMTSGGFDIKFQANASGVGPFATLASNAPEADPVEARKHFEHYYKDLLRDKNGNALPANERFRITDSTAETYDCIPPGATPPLP